MMYLMNTSELKSLSIGKLAAQAGVGIDTVRFYERRQLLPKPARTPSGYRKYDFDSVARIRFIRRAKDLGFTLDEVETLLGLHDNGGAKAEVKALTTRKLEQIDAKIDHLHRMRSALENLNDQCSGTGDVSGCPIIDSLSHDES